MKTTILLITLLMNLIVWGQVPQTILVEHFTNTRCGVCANRNPGFFTNLNAQSNVLHMAVHPSAPYSSCLLNQHNKAENDARTQFYNIYGSTPRLVIDGTPISTAADYGSSSLFAPYLGKTAPITIAASINDNGADVDVRIVIKVVTGNMLSNLLISGFLVEEVVNYSAPNGEQTHYNVFRKGIFPMVGEPFTIPANGDSIVFEKNVSKNAGWDLSKIFALITVQQSNKQTVQSGRSENLTTTTGVRFLTNDQKISAVIFPNPATELLKLELVKIEKTIVQLLDINGKVVFENVFSDKLVIPTTELKSGLYLVRLYNESGESVSKVSIIH